MGEVFVGTCWMSTVMSIHHTQALHSRHYCSKQWFSLLVTLTTGVMRFCCCGACENRIPTTLHIPSHHTSRDGAIYTLHLHLLHLLLIMTSTQLYTMDAASPPGAHPFTDLLIAQPHLRGPLVQALVRLLVRRPLPPRDADMGAGVLGELGERKLSVTKSACMM